MPELSPRKLFLHLDTSNTLQVGTCEHCVIAEAGRPERAWDAEGDRDLDFARDELIARLAARGIRVTVEDQYVCP